MAAPTRTDPEKHRQQVRNANDARKAAVDRLIALHPDEFDRLYAFEARQRGVTPTGRRS